MTRADGPIDPHEHVPTRSVGWVDLAMMASLAAILYLIVSLARSWSGPLPGSADLDLGWQHLPLYAFLSLSRGLIAYGISFLFTLVYGYLMARVASAERVMLPVLDILQSIPVLGFLPGFVLGLVQLFPHRRVGLELASVLMIFTGQVWNMTFSFYASLKSVPPDLVAVARLARMSWWERFLRLDLSFAATGLLWNSMMSMAGGWFFLMVSEAFVLGDRDFRLPGLGAYMSLAIEKEDRVAQVLGVVTMLGMIVLLDQLVWRPLVAWSHKFSDEEPPPSRRSWLWDHLRGSRFWQEGRSLRARLRSTARPLAPVQPANVSRQERTSQQLVLRILRDIGLILLGMVILFGAGKYLHLLTSVSWNDWIYLLRCTAASFARVTLAVAIATFWALPVGVLIGRHPHAAKVMQPIIQMAASFPAPMIFPLVVGLLATMGAGLGISSVFLLMLGAQWYILFNVIAGTGSIPRELWEVAHLGRFSRWQTWRRLILPAVFPSLLTGWITATGGAWNASIVAEYMSDHGRTLETIGLGSAISAATEHGRFPQLAAAVGIMALVVVTFNRLVWRPLSHRAQVRYGMDT